MGYRKGPVAWNELRTYENEEKEYQVLSLSVTKNLYALYICQKVKRLPLSFLYDLQHISGKTTSHPLKPSEKQMFDLKWVNMEDRHVLFYLVSQKETEQE